MTEFIAGASIPVIVFIRAVIILFSKKDLGNEFLKGAKEGLETSISLIPGLVMLLSGVQMLMSSGIVDVLCHLFKPVISLLGLPSDILPVLLLRPFSGSATTAVADSLFASVGPDSKAGLCASILMGASDTIIYTISLYYTSSNIKKTSFSLPASFAALVFCAVLSSQLCTFFFG